MSHHVFVFRLRTRLPLVFAALATLLLCCSSLTAQEEAIFQTGFEVWDTDSGSPGDYVWKRVDGTELDIFRLSSEEKHGGESSLHLEDTSAGNANNIIFHRLSRQIQDKVKGKILRVSGWIKQQSASRPGTFTIGIAYIRDGYQSFAAGPQVTGATPWSEYSVSVPIPEDITDLRVAINCCLGFGNTGEAYFDDIRVEVVENQQMSMKPRDFSGLMIYDDGPLDFWGVHNWGGILAEQAEAAALYGGKGLRIMATDTIRPFAGVRLSTDYINRGLSPAGFPEDLNLVFFVKPLKRMQIEIKSGYTSEKLMVTPEMTSPAADGWLKVSVPLPPTLNRDSVISSILLQFPDKLARDEIIMLDEIHLSANAKDVPPATYAWHSPNLKAEFEALCQSKAGNPPEPAELPVVKDGTFHVAGKPVFYSGPWISSGSFRVDWNESSARPVHEDEIYQEPFNRRIADVMGMNSAQISAAMLEPMYLAKELAVEDKSIENLKRNIQFYQGMQGMPVILDFAWINAMGHLNRNPELTQKNSHWCAFVPLCPEHPEGLDIYREYWYSGTRFALDNGANPFIYEVFNESSYNCSCAFNRASFVRELKEAYGNIESLNGVLGTFFASFEEIESLSKYERSAPIWAEWCKFSGRRYAAVIREGREVIREADPRPGILFCEQLHNSSIYSYTGAGMDYTLVAEEMDVLAIEGGRVFGSSQSLSGDDKYEAAMATSGTTYTFIMDLFVALSRHRKPVVNVEHYCGRFLLGKRQPTKASDIHTTLWNEVFHGLSGSFFYAWCKRVWEWKTYEDAKEMVIDGGYKAFQMLTPYAYPRESLDGFRTFREELELIGEIALPMPRLKPATVGVVFSYPSLRMSAVNQFDLKKRLTDYYAALLYSQYPLEVVLEEDLPALDLGRFQALVLPFQHNSYATTLPALEQYVRGGGVLFCSPGSLLYDEHNRMIDPLPLSGFTPPIYRQERQPPQSYTVVAADAFEDSATAALVANPVDKGRVFYLTRDLSYPALRRSLRQALTEAGVVKHGEVAAEDGEPLEEAEFQIIDRGAKKLLYLVNWQDRGTRLIRLRLNLSGNSPQYLCSPDGATVYLNPTGGDNWADKELKEGVLLSLPPQQSLVLMLTDEKPAHKSTTSQTQQAEITARARKAEAAGLAEVDELVRKSVAGAQEARSFPPVDPVRCLSLDLRKVVNMEFRDEVSGDGKGGWFDQGANDYRNLPLGQQIFSGVPFEIIDPAKNGGRSALILRGAPKPEFPARAEGIVVGAKAARLYFLHAAGWSAPEGTVTHRYVVHYADGGVTEIPVRLGQEIEGWWKPKPIPGAKIAAESSNSLCDHIGMYVQAWDNPAPQREIKGIDIVSAEGRVVPAVVAITLERP